MKLPWITAQQHADALKAKDDRIAELEAATEANAGSETVTKLEALFGDAAQEEGFDLVAAVESIQQAAADNATELTQAQKDLKTAQATTTGIAKLVGAKEGDDLVAAVAALTPEQRTNPLEVKEKKINSKEMEAYRCEIDDEIDAARANFAIPPHARN